MCSASPEGRWVVASRLPRRRKGRVVHVVGHNGLPWTVYQPSRLHDEEAPVPIAGWEAAGLPEHAGLERLINLRAELTGR